MSAFSASDAALEGFQMLRTHWRVVVGWAVFNLLALVAMIVITVISAWGSVLRPALTRLPGGGRIGGVAGGLVTGPDRDRADRRRYR